MWEMPEYQVSRTLGVPASPTLIAGVWSETLNSDGDGARRELKGVRSALSICSLQHHRICPSDGTSARSLRT
eukprot:Skav212819  [mRNA]  locus=scaffold2618:43938:44153:+ [translate_table: standard]